MNKQSLGLIFNRLAIVLFILAGIFYAATKIGGVTFCFIGAGIIAALVSIILLLNDKSTLKKPYKVLNYLFILIPILVFVGLIIYWVLLGAALRGSNLPG